MRAGAALGELLPWLFVPSARAPSGAGSRGRTVCNCLNVSENEIRQEINAGATLDDLQARLKCGTSCGSCMPELRRMLAETPR